MPHYVCLCVCLCVRRVATARRISLGGEGNALYPVFSSLRLYVNKQLKEAQTVCRGAKGECDLPEYCSGTDPLCPSDVYRRNTDNCTVNGVRQPFLSSTYIFLSTYIGPSWKIQ